METERRLREQKPAKTLDDVTLSELVQVDTEQNPFHREGYEDYSRKQFLRLVLFVRNTNEPGLFTRVKNKIKSPFLSNYEISLVSQRWQNFADNSRVQEALGKGSLKRTEEVINRSILKELFNSNSSDINFASQEMKEFKNSTLAPFQVLENAGKHTYRDDFGWKQTHNYFSEFSQERLDELKNNTVPGLKEIVEMVTTQPEALTQEDLLRLKTEVTKMALHYLRDGTIEEKSYIARAMPRGIISEEAKPQITEILESDKTPKAVTMKFFTSHIGNDRFKNHSSVALEMLLEYLAKHKNPKLKDLLSLYEGELIDKFIERDIISSQNIATLSKVFGESENAIRRMLEFAKRQKQQDPDPYHVRFGSNDRSTDGTVKKLINLSDMESLVTELQKYGFVLNSYQLDENLFNRLQKQKDTILPFIAQLHALGYDLSLTGIQELPYIERAFRKKESLLVALSDIKRHDPEFRYRPYSRDEKGYADPYELHMLNARYNMGGEFYDKLLAIKNVEGYMPQRFSDPLQKILRDENSPSHIDRKTHQMKKDKLPEPSEKSKLEFQEAINTVLKSVSKDKEENDGQFLWFYNDRGFLRFLSLNPGRIKEILCIPERFPDLPKLMSDNRDAKNRLTQFLNAVFQEELPEQAVTKVIESARRATELDLLGTKLLSNSEIAKMIGGKDWYASLLKATNFEEANNQLTRSMTELAIPVAYSDLKGNALAQRQTQIVDKATGNHEFEETLEICCRSVGIYSTKYPRRGTEFDTLIKAIRTSLELNLESNPALYAQKRFEQSSSQFDRLFEDFPLEIREKTLTMWSDLSKRRRLRVSGSDITDEEATLSRLNSIRGLVRNDLSIHLQTLFTEKVKTLEPEVEADRSRNAVTDQHAIFKKYLYKQEGQLRQDIPLMYLSVERFIHDAQRKLKDPETLREEKAILGRNLGTYQAMSDSLRALYKLGTINEERYKIERSYLDQIDEHIGKLSASLKRVRILDPERRSQDVNLRALEEEVLIDLGNLKSTMSSENISSQAVFETESTVSFNHLAQAPNMTQSCQRLTELTGFNHAAYSRLLDGVNEMVDVYEMENGKRNRLARSFIELSKVKLDDEEKPRLSVLFDRQYVNPQYQNFTNHFYTEMVAHLIDRINNIPEVSLIIPYQLNPQIETLLKDKGYQARQITAQYFVNESNVRLYKYYDSAGGIRDVRSAHYSTPQNLYLIEKI